ncbi:MAG: ROK family protein, partial [Sulfolobales archaeon]
IAIKYVDEYLMLVNSAGIASTINAYDPEILIMGGSVALNNKEAFAKGLDRYLDKYITVRKPVIRFTEFGDDMGIYGAAALSIKTPESLKEYIEAWNKR